MAAEFDKTIEKFHEDSTSTHSVDAENVYRVSRGALPMMRNHTTCLCHCSGFYFVVDSRLHGDPPVD